MVNLQKMKISTKILNSNVDFHMPLGYNNKWKRGAVYGN